MAQRNDALYAEVFLNQETGDILANTVVALVITNPEPNINPYDANSVEGNLSLADKTMFFALGSVLLHGVVVIMCNRIKQNSITNWQHSVVPPFLGVCVIKQIAHKNY